MRQWRGARERDVAITSALKGFVREQSRLAKALGTVAESFEAVVPPDIAAECTLVGLRGGVLTVETRSASARFALDRLLRAGGEADIRARSDAAGTRISRLRLISHHDRS